MLNEELIRAEDFCTHNNISFSFVRSLSTYGLIELTTIEETQFIHGEQLKRLEQMSRLHHDLNINMEGLDAIVHLLQKVEQLQQEIAFLKSRLKIFEP
jgi:hypothetical protein